MVLRSADLDKRLRRYSVARRPDGDYRGVIVRCPTHPDQRQYQADHILAVHDEPGLAYIQVRCYWCDTHGRVRGCDAGFDRDAGQPHAYLITEVTDE